MLRFSRMLVVLLAGWLVMGSSAQAQFFFQSEALLYQRTNQGGTTVISGPQSVSTRSGDFGFEPGYRLTLGTGIGEYQIDASFLQITPWSSRSGGTFADALFFDDAAVDLGMDPANVLAGLSGLREAAMSSLPGGPSGFSPLEEGQLAPYMNVGLAGGADESTEGEFLNLGATYSTRAKSNYRDFEINLGTNRNTRRWRVSTGFRHIDLDEANQVRVVGEFDAVDVAAGPDPNDGLSHQALVNAGFAVVSNRPVGYEDDAGADQTTNSTADGITATSATGAPVFLAWQADGRAYNDLNGAQLTFAYRLVDSEYFILEGISKAGLFHNNARGLVRETVAASGADDSVYQRTFTDSKSTAAFAGNLGLRSMTAVTDYISFIAGYELVYLNGVALGGDQNQGLREGITGATTYETKTGGSMFAHGGTLGLELTF